MSDSTPGFVPRIWQSADQPAFHKIFALELDDHLDVQHASRQLLPAGPSIGAMAVLGLFISLISNYGLWQSGDRLSFAINVVAAVAGCAVLAALLLKPARYLMRRIYNRRLIKAGALGKPIDSTVDKNGISYTVLGQTITCTWDSLYALEEDAGTFYFWMSKMVSHPWPARIFASPEEQQSLREMVQIWAGRPFGPPVLARLGFSGRANLPD